MAHLFIRTDCSATIGTGHFSRCLALACAWMAQGGKATFLSHCNSDVLRARLQRDGIDLIPVHSSHPDPSDLKFTLQTLNKFRLHNPGCGIWTVLDGYHFDTVYQQSTRRVNPHVMVIDDMNHLPYYDADVLLNQNIHADTLGYNCSDETILLLGLEYVLLRPEFLVYRRVQLDPPSVARKLLVTLGGSDPGKVTMKAIEALRQVDIAGLEATVVVGPANPRVNDIREELKRSDFTWHMIHAPDNMAELMEWADLAISAGGSTCWELAFMGLPTIVIVTADNQWDSAGSMGKVGAALCMGWHNQLDVEHMAMKIACVAQDRDLRATMSRCGRQIVNGYGADQIVNIMINYSETHKS